MKLFELGQTLITPNALDFCEANPGVDIPKLLERHQSGDWGDMSAHDKKQNNAAVQNGARIFSAYRFQTGRIWIVTEAMGDDGKRASTCVLLPEDY